MSSTATVEPGVQLRIHGSPALPTLIYLPGMHGDWTLVASFRHEIAGKVRFVEISYPRTTTWTLEDYAREIEKALSAVDVSGGWLIGESFGSQVAWAIVGRIQRNESRLKLDGLILAGGFVKHPWPWGACFLRWILGWIPSRAMRAGLGMYSSFAHFRHRHAPETLASIGEFVSNRLAPGDRESLQHRLSLIAKADPRPVASKARLPVYQLAGLIDPLVPSALIHRWLTRNCQGFQASRTILSADHNVLGSAPSKSAERILAWVIPRAD